MSFEVGNHIWLPCDVKPGAFSDEPMVRVQAEGFEWLGFVPIFSLKDPITQGKTSIPALITNVEGDRFTIRFPGHALTSPFLQGSISKVKSLAHVFFDCERDSMKHIR